MQEWSVRENVKLRIVNPDDAENLYQQIEKTRSQLAKYMPWGESTKSVEDERKFLTYCQGRIADKKLLALSIWINGEPVGMIDLHNIDLDNSHAEVGRQSFRDCLLRLQEGLRVSRSDLMVVQR